MSRSTPVIGIYYDSFTSISGNINKSKKVTVEQTATKLADDVVKKVNSAYAFEPPLSLENDMSFQYYPDIAQTADLHLTNKLITMVTPKPEHAGRTTELWKELNKENKALKQKNNELNGGAGQGTAGLHHGDFMSLRKTMADLQAMVTQQRDALAEETDNRKALASALAEEKDNRKALASALAKEKADRKAEMANEKADRKAEMANEKVDRKVEMELRIAESNRLEDLLENQKDENNRLLKDLQSKQDRLTKEMSEHATDMKSISELTLRLIPLHCRVLLDCARKRVLVIMGLDSWADLVKNQSVEQVTTAIVLALANAQIQDPPPREAIRYLCSYNNVRKDGNYHAHNATREDMRDAVLTKRLDSQDRVALTYFFQFVFGQPA